MKFLIALLLTSSFAAHAQVPANLTANSISFKSCIDGLDKKVTTTGSQKKAFDQDLSACINSQYPPTKTIFTECSNASKRAFDAQVTRKLFRTCRERYADFLPCVNGVDALTKKLEATASPETKKSLEGQRSRIGRECIENNYSLLGKVKCNEILASSQLQGEADLQDMCNKPDVSRAKDVTEPTSESQK